MGFNGIVVATKADKVKRSQRQKKINKIRQKLLMGPSDVLLEMSSETRQGKYEFWDIVNQLMEINEYDITFERQ
jgi:GTP-binding protein